MATRGTTRLARALGSAARAVRVSRAYSTAPSNARPAVGKLAAGLTVVGAGVWTLQTQDSDLGLSALLADLTVRADAAAKPDALDLTKPGAVRVDSATDAPFPVKLHLATPGPLLTLVGLGVRTVSFLRMKVYSAGFYLEDADSGKLDTVPGWHTFTAQHLLVPPVPSKSTGAVESESPQLSGEALMRNLIDRPVASAVRIVPVRNTDFAHLRDGFTRAIAGRQKLARKAGQLTDADDERIAESTQALKALFPAKAAPKGKALTMLRTPSGALVVEYDGTVLGQVNDPWVSRELLLAYFADKDVISPKLKEDVAHGLEAFVKH